MDPLSHPPDEDEARQRLAVSERFLAAVVEHSADAIATLASDRTILSWNGGCERLWGIPAEQAVGRRLDNYLSPTSVPRLTRLIDPSVESPARHIELEALDQAGHPILLETAIAPIADEFGHIATYSLIARDITARKHAELHLRSQRDVLELIVQDRPLPEILESLVSVAQTVSPRPVVATILLATPDGKHLRVAAGQDAPLAWTKYVDGMKIAPIAGSCGTSAFRRERVIVGDIAQDPLWTEFAQEALRHGFQACWSTPILASSGSILGTFAIYYPEPAKPTDREIELIDVITRTAVIAIERKRNEMALAESTAQLKEHARELEARVKERTIKLEETIGELEAFSYTLSHDMRSPLRAMHSYADILVTDYKDALDPDAQLYLSRIKQNSTRLDLLVRDVLAYSKVAKGAVELLPVDLRTFLDHLLSTAPELDPASIDIAFPADLPMVLAHEAYLGQVLTNLLANAQKFADPNRPVEVSIRAVKTNVSTVKVEVRDSGIGIEPEHLGRLFKMFGRIHPESQFPGTGIGLAIVLKAVQRMGGQVGVLSEPGKGSCFWFTLKTA